MTTVASHDHMIIDDCVDKFTTYLKDVKMSSSNTVDAYVRDLRNFREFCHSESIDEPATVTADELSGFKIYLAHKGLSVASVSRSMSAVRSLYQFLVENGVVDFNPARMVPNDKCEKKGPQVLTSKEISLLLSQPSTGDVKGIRDKAMLEVLYATGIKVSELIALDVTDVNLKLSFIRCGGNGKERFIPLYPLAVKAVSDYLELSRKLLIVSKDEQALFVNVSGERMSRQGFWKIIKTYAQQAQIHKPITPHTIRHSFAAHLLENGADIHDIQEILGHADLSSTQRYAHFLKERMQASYMKFHPRA